MIRSAQISLCGKYRYRLDRRWSEGPTACFVMLNPSTADADVDDPTIRRCIGFAKREGCGALAVINLFPYRATKPKDLWAVPDFVRSAGFADVDIVNDALKSADLIIAAWGAVELTKVVAATNHLRTLGAKCLGKTKDGHPRHPLYVRGDAPLISL